MGGEHSSGKKTEEKHQDCGDCHGSEPAAVEGVMMGKQSSEKKTEDCGDCGGSEPAAAEENPGEVPQRKMGNKKVDDMCFMIVCTNWY